MEQLNKQPIQEPTENKPPIKTNWKPRRNPFGILRGRYLAIVGVFALLAIGGILLLKTLQPASSPTPIAQQTPPPTPSPQPQTLDTSNWQTYRNDEFGFEFEYPTTISIKDWSAEQEKFYHLYLLLGTDADFPDSAVSVVIAKKTDGIAFADLDEELNREIVFWPNVPSSVELEDVTIGRDNYRAKRFEKNFLYKFEDVNEINFVKYIVEHYNRLYQILYDKNDSRILSEDEFDQILSTIRFIGEEYSSQNGNWNVPLNLAECKKGEQRTLLHGLGSKTVVVQGPKGNGCVVEYTNEIEGGYTTYECVWDDSPPEIDLSTINVGEGCIEIRSGNLLLENQ